MYMGKRLLYILAFADIQKIHVDVDMITKQLIWEVERVTERLTEDYFDDMQKITRHYAKSNNIDLNTGGNDFQDIIDKLAEYETAEEEGRLVILPCKIGTIVYVIRQSWNGWNIDKKKFSYAMIGKVGKTVFLTSEEAEKALKEMNKNE